MAVEIETLQLERAMDRLAKELQESASGTESIRESLANLDQSVATLADVAVRLEERLTAFLERKPVRVRRPPQRKVRAVG